MIYSIKDFAKKSREAASEGIVMLRNEGGVLPLGKDTKVAVFGRNQFNYYKMGTGSGGMVHVSYTVGILDALEADEGITVNQTVKAAYESWIKDHPYNDGKGWMTVNTQDEMPLDKELVENAGKESDTAIIIIGRICGEGRDNTPDKGSYLLTDEEENILRTVCGTFSRTVVLLNVGNIIDMKWVDEARPSSVLYVWQGGQDGGNAVLDVLKGDATPSGRLTDTIAYDISDYPSTKNFGIKDVIYEEGIFVGYRHFETFAKDKVLYPFGYGLSYTTFDVTPNGCTESDENVEVGVTVRNTGYVPGKEVVQVYCEAPKGRLDKAKRVLCGFAKTRLLSPGESQAITINIPKYYLASYDEFGVTGYRSCYVLEEGIYTFYVGSDVRSDTIAGTYMFNKLVVVRQLEEALAPIGVRTVNPMERRNERLPREAGHTKDLGYKLSDVAQGKVSMDDFLVQLSNDELACLLRGEGVCSPKANAGVVAAFGGITDELSGYGIPIACCSDGPSGIRMDNGAFAYLMPNATCLASTFNTELVTELYEWEALELRKNKIDSLLGPGMNIHRSPLNGRNFEYFSEDPLLTGKMAAAQLRGMDKHGIAGTIKHFACNNQEHARNTSDSVVSERALREICLKGFEIAVTEGKARSIMSSYNKINGVWTASNYDLLTTILRGEWGYTGFVMTDWWAYGNDEGGEGTIKNVAQMIRAQNDIYMVTRDSKTNANDDNIMESLRNGSLTRGECIRSASNLCRFLLTTPAYQRMINGESELDIKLRDMTYEGEHPVTKNLNVSLVDETIDEMVIEGKDLDISRNALNQVLLNTKDDCIIKVAFTCRASEATDELEQLPITVFKGNEVAMTMSVTGADKEWRTFEMEHAQPVRRHNLFLKFYFVQGNVEVKEVRFKIAKPS